MKRRSLLWTALFLLAVGLTPTADAQLESEIPEGWSPGPTTAALGSVALIDVPDGYVFADQDTTRTVMEQMGNQPTGREVGLVMPAAEENPWFVVFEYFPVGYVADDDKDEIDAQALLASLSEGTEQANEYRRERGIPAIHVTGWYEEPHYDDQSHNLVWALQAADEEGGDLVNHNVRLLGRSGYMSATLVTDPARMATDQATAEALLAGFSYSPGHKYAEFRKGDKLAGYGLAALVAGGAGVAAAKLGLFSKLGKLLVGLWKVILLGLAALGASLKKLFGGRSAVSHDSDVEPV
jgi:uncharacterized membrane-anchored protein